MNPNIDTVCLQGALLNSKTTQKDWKLLLIFQYMQYMDSNHSINPLTIFAIILKTESVMYIVCTLPVLNLSLFAIAYVYGNWTCGQYTVYSLTILLEIMAHLLTVSKEPQNAHQVNP